MAFPKVGYDDGAFAAEGTTEKVERKIDDVMAHLQAYFCHSSLGSKVKITMLSAKHYAGMRFQPCGADARAMQPYAESDLQGANLMIFYGKPYKPGQSSGIAYGKRVCSDARFNKLKLGMATWRKDAASLAEVWS